MSLLRRLLPDGLAGRFALLLSASLIAANLLALAVLSFERGRLDRAAVAAREGERIASLVPALEAAAPTARPSIARAASTRSSRVTIDPEPLVAIQPDAPRSSALARDLTEALGPRDIRAAIRVRGEREGRGSGETVTASVRLAVAEGGQPQWLNVRSRGGRPRPPWIEEGAFLLILGLSLTAVLVVGLLFVRRQTRPLTALAAAARAAGQGDRTVRLTAKGPREIRDAAAAFNDMQTRIARFDAERLRTLAAVGHDLRTPITSLRIRAEMLDPDEGDPMIRTLDEMTVMADGLVAYARGAGDGEALQDVDLGALLDRVCIERGASCDVRDAARVKGRPVALGRAIGNLVDNALHYGGTARATLTHGGSAVTVTIDDDGPGIPEDQLATIFDPFVRGDDSRSPETGGAGLGLAIARDIIAAHGGTVTLENRTKGGLRATVRLPMVEQASG
ncbi:MAG: ATP-binding protein [Pseudomonadota bacterium]